VRLGVDDSDGAATVIADTETSKAPQRGEHHDRPAPPADQSPRRRFTFAVVIGSLLAAIPYTWVLWGPWESPDPIRETYYEDNFYELQARAIFHGHLWLQKGSIGIEAFVHDGRQYTYFGLFPSLIRMPILLVTSSLDGHLTGCYMLAAFVFTALLTAMLMWRVRILVRGQAPMGRLEATSYGLLAATFLMGTIWILLAETPYVFDEDLAWSICLTVGTLFTLLGVLEKPSWGRVVAAGLFMLGGNLDRVTTAVACVIGAFLIAAWFGLGYGGRENRRWCIPLLVAAGVPLLVDCALNYAKFGMPIGVPSTTQVWTQVNAHRRQFLAANANSETGTAFIQTNLFYYFRPDALRFTSTFPFVTLPASPPVGLNGVIFDRLYRTASITASTPLLCLLTVWGFVAAFRRKRVGKIALTRIVLIAALIAAGALMLWGYIAPRYLADFVPLLVMGGAVAMPDIWQRLEGRRRSVRVGVFSAIAVLAVFSIVANIGIALTPTDEWTPNQVYHYVQVQKAVSDVTGHPLDSYVRHGNSLPPYAPAGELYVIGNCQGLYISNGENYSTVPNQQYQRETWMTVQLGHEFRHAFNLTVQPEGSASGTGGATLMKAGDVSVQVGAAPGKGAYKGEVEVVFAAQGPHSTIPSIDAYVAYGSLNKVIVLTEPQKHTIQVWMNGTLYLDGVLNNGTPITAGQPATVGHLISVTNVTGSTPQPTLCQSFTH
jgi:hypothetical protein